MKTVELSFEEGMAAVMQGATQMMRAIRSGWVGNDHGGKSGRDMRERWAQAIHGQMCEVAICKGLDKYPAAGISGISGDDPGGFAIRGTPWANGCLIVNGSELPKNSDKTYILVCGHWPHFEMAGWILGKDAARDEWWRGHEKPASWWVPQSALRPISELRQ